MRRCDAMRFMICLYDTIGRKSEIEGKGGGGARKADWVEYI